MVKDDAEKAARKSAREARAKLQYEAGASAARDGKDDTACPYAVSGSAFDHWMRGYRSAKAAHRELRSGAVGDRMNDSRLATYLRGAAASGCGDNSYQDTEWSATDLMRHAAERIERLSKLDREAANYVESVIVMRTRFTGDPPYVGWKGLGLALTEALDERDALRDEVARKQKPND